MSDSPLEATFSELDLSNYIALADEKSLVREIAYELSQDIQQPTPERLPRLGFIYESQGITTLQKWVTKQDDNGEKEFREYFRNAFSCWRSIISVYETSEKDLDKDAISKYGLHLIESELRGEPIRADLILSFRLAISGLLGNHVAETRLELKRFRITTSTSSSNWNEQVAENVFSAITLLVRKANGWDDIDVALSKINKLRQLQKEYENLYLNDKEDKTNQVIAALELVGLYHLAQMVTITGEYLRDGANAVVRVRLQLDRHYERAVASFQSSKSTLHVHLASLLWAGCRELVQNSIWSHIDGLGEATRRFAQLLASKGNSKPVLELWPSQQHALSSGLMDSYRRAIIVELPTSAGKTLLAKFIIVQTKTLNPEGAIAYIVPTRALVNQITLDLRQDFGGLDKPRISVEQAVPAFELDPTEERLLSNRPDIIVTTPEKLDLLIRSDHPSVQNLSLVIADEAHSIGDKNRGSRLELLLGTIKRDRPTSRFLLLSPFLPNSDELVLWLGEDRALPPIRMVWKPGRKIVGSVTVQGRGEKRNLVLETLPASANVDVREGIQIVIGSAQSVKKTKSAITRATVQALRNRGSVLILCEGRLSAVSEAEMLVKELPLIPTTLELEAVCKYLDAEVGRKSGLSECLRHGVAFHHSGLSHEARWLIERLISRGVINVVCGTTTLAQGMNFPITTVIINTLKKGEENLTYQDFWNIAGRAGRALMDTLGVVSFPTRNLHDRKKYIDFLRIEAEQISSQLAALIDQAQEIADQFDFNIAALRNWPQLSALLQFLAHAMRVSGNSDIADEVEDLMRASLVYYQARRKDEETAKRLIELCRSYLFKIKNNKGLLGLADKTGFATPSVLSLLYTQRQNEFAVPDNWQPDRLFSNDLQPMTDRIEAIAQLPEIELGQGANPPFNAKLVAGILRDWVLGENLDSLTKKYWKVDDASDPEKNTTEFCNYLFSRLIGRASWGIGALETISLAGVSQEKWQEVGYIPSMIFFGVQKKEAIWLRMVGVPRVVANSLGQLWQNGLAQDPRTYDDIRKWVTELTDNEWKQAIPKGTELTPDDMRVLWKEFVA